jgi:hypothetical protein
MDSIVIPKVKTMEGERVEAHSLACSTSKVERCAGTLRWGLKKLTNKSITHTDLHKLKNKLISV